MPEVPSLKQLDVAAQFAQWSALFAPPRHARAHRPTPARRRESCFG
jgi:hypothetical protein